MLTYNLKGPPTIMKKALGETMKEEKEKKVHQKKSQKITIRGGEGWG